VARLDLDRLRTHLFGHGALEVGIDRSASGGQGIVRSAKRRAKALISEPLKQQASIFRKVPGIFGINNNGVRLPKPALAKLKAGPIGPRSNIISGRLLFILESSAKCPPDSATRNPPLKG
jgi:hypothetical protein